MSLSTKFEPQSIEKKWYSFWQENAYFESKPNPDKEPYTIVIPPPNVTGVLHMGHMLNNTIQDILVRRARMQGKEACWVPGTDHASIATEAKVVAMLREQGIAKESLSRDEFLKHAWEWKEKYGGIILEQLKYLGASCDWSRTKFTMDEDMSKAVISVFIDLYEKGKIYRGVRMVNWDPAGKTALSDDEVIHREVNSKLYHIRYKLEDSDDYLIVATTRPETLLGDTAVCINPKDERYAKYRGKRVVVPLINRVVPIIEDEYVDMEFGTGCLKITPAHDINDYELGHKHQLDSIDILNDDGTLHKNAGLYIGEDRFVVRDKIAKDLAAADLLEKEEPYKNKVGFSERTDAVVEPKLSMQWFLKMEEITQPALESVMNDVIRLHPPKFKNMYRAWMENVRDWCISRQLWWGHRIPAYYLPDGTTVVAKSMDEALEKAKKQSGNDALTENDLRQDEDVLDTWFSSWLWPISVFDGIENPENEDFKYYYPTNDLVTAPEILFFWVARMIIAGYEYQDMKPFSNVYLTGIVRDKKGRKMSKSLGNSPDPLSLIEKYGADGVRTGMLFSSPAGNDLPFDEKLCEQGRNFNNKIWNAYRLIDGLEVDENAEQPEDRKIAIEWFRSRFYQELEQIEDHFEKFRISDALMATYKLVWNDFCSWYLEMIKPNYGEKIDKKSKAASIEIFEHLLKVMHPFMPFITEELWQNIKERSKENALIVSAWPAKDVFDRQLLNEGELAFECISAIRNLRSSKGISPKEAFSVDLRSKNPKNYERFESLIKKMANLSEFNQVDEATEGTTLLVVKGDELYVHLNQEIDVEAEKAELQKEIEYTEGFLKQVNKKLSNERFVNNAPAEVVAVEKKKQSDAEEKLKSLKASLANLG
ncbi:MAG: valine--tRNA ligase [Cyclobacteriaceae bacterium]|nr:valine--tRNA ligase [Cyclobacteriaceae bacterium]MCH8515564.1 valine--tRNA ligase [Cyclobacteriaceae bacterium]